MYTIHLNHHQFQCKENINPFINQLIIQSKLLEYFVNIKSHERLHFTMHYINIFNSNNNITIKLMVENYSNVLYLIKFIQTHTPFYRIEIEEENNFAELLSRIIQRL